MVITVVEFPRGKSTLEEVVLGGGCPRSQLRSMVLEGRMPAECARTVQDFNCERRKSCTRTRIPDNYKHIHEFLGYKVYRVVQDPLQRLGLRL